MKNWLTNDQITGYRKIEFQSEGKDYAKKLFFHFYNPNLFFGTMAMGIPNTVPEEYRSNFVIVDESTMSQPSDLAQFASKLQSFTPNKSMRYILFGGHLQLEPYNQLSAMAALTMLKTGY